MVYRKKRAEYEFERELEEEIEEMRKRKGRRMDDMDILSISAEEET